jgi:hypothetical protein
MSKYNVMLGDMQIIFLLLFKEWARAKQAL